MFDVGKPRCTSEICQSDTPTPEFYAVENKAGVGVSEQRISKMHLSFPTSNQA